MNNRIYGLYYVVNKANETFQAAVFWVETFALINKIYQRAKGNQSEQMPPF